MRVSACFYCALFACSAGSAADIRQTPHNLRQDTTGNGTEVAEVCVFCHAPAKAASASGRNDAPAARWQRALAAEFAFSTYDAAGVQGMDSLAGTHSLVCLSCHEQSLQSGGSPVFEGHPFGVPYGGAAGDAVAAVPESGGSGLPRRRARGLAAAADFRPPSSGVVGGRPAWWISATGPAPWRGPADLPLFARAGPDSAGAMPFIECGTCHDPHKPKRNFLRVDEPMSSLCLTCHAM